MRQEHDGLLRMVHDLSRETGLIMQDQRNFISSASGNVACSNDYELVPGNPFTVTNRFDASTRHSAADGSSVEHAGHSDVVDVARTARDFVHAFNTRNGAAH